MVAIKKESSEFENVSYKIILNLNVVIKPLLLKSKWILFLAF